MDWVHRTSYDRIRSTIGHLNSAGSVGPRRHRRALCNSVRRRHARSTTRGDGGRGRVPAFVATSPARRASKRGETAHHHQESGRQPGRERSRARRGHLSPDAAVAGRGARRKAANDLRLREGHSEAPRSTQSCRNGCERACAHVPQVEQCWQAATVIWSGGDGFP